MFPNRPGIFQLKPLASLRLTDPMIEFQQEGKEHHRRIFLLLHIIYRTTWASNVAPYMFCRIHLYMSFVVHTLQRGLLPPPFVILPYFTCISQPPAGLASSDCSSTTCARRCLRGCFAAIINLSSQLPWSSQRRTRRAARLCLGHVHVGAGLAWPGRS